MAKKSKLDSLSQTHGKVENRKVTLDQIWGDDGKSKYGTLDPVEKVLRDSKIAKSEIDDVVLVGGSTRIPKVQQLLID
jgi:L1 cell adhesion molecule like protein